MPPREPRTETTSPRANEGTSLRSEPAETPYNRCLLRPANQPRRTQPPQPGISRRAHRRRR